jgi:hypothetical protein
MQSFVDQASNIHIIEGARIIKNNYLHQGILLDRANPLILNSVQAIKNHLNGNRPLSNNQVKTYMASSVLLHTLDGWGYLSSAIDNLLKGDPSIATHLAYYAELRASMSFLASEGIGIFNNRHIHVDSAGNINPNPGVIQRNRNHNGRTNVKREFGTHQFVWDAMEAWINSSIKPNNFELLKVFSVNNKTFEQWTKAFPHPVSSTGNVIIKKWLRKWNTDVRYFRSDRDTRNFASYTPQRLTNTPLLLSVNQVIDKLSSFWELIEPEETNRFHILDKYLLRIYIQELYSSLSAPLKRQSNLESIIKDTLDALGLNHDKSFIDFLKDTNIISHDLFVEAHKNALDSSTGVINALSVIARAALMLRIATGMTTLILSEAGIAKNDLNFLWNRVGTENGFWISGKIPVKFEELWTEIKDDIDDVAQWSKTFNPNLCLSQIYADDHIPLSFNYFSQFHRASLWGIAI